MDVSVMGNVCPKELAEVNTRLSSRPAAQEPLEPRAKPIELLEADDGASEGEEGVMNVGALLVTDVRRGSG
jgi:hypothetical protein